MSIQFFINSIQSNSIHLILDIAQGVNHLRERSGAARNLSCGFSYLTLGTKRGRSQGFGNFGFSQKSILALFVEESGSVANNGEFVL